MYASNWQQILSVSVQGGRVGEVMACYDNASMSSEWSGKFQIECVTGVSFLFHGLFGFKDVGDHRKYLLPCFDLHLNDLIGCISIIWWSILFNARRKYRDRSYSMRGENIAIQWTKIKQKLNYFHSSNYYKGTSKSW